MAFSTAARYTQPQFNRRTTTARIVCALACAIAVVFLWQAAPQPALAKSYSIDSVDIRAQLSSDGAMNVTEKRTFNFNGDFSYVYWDFPYSSGQRINVASLTAAPEGGTPTALKASDTSGQPGTYSIEDTGEGLRLTAYVPVSDERLTYNLAYTESGVVAHHADAAELYWQFIGKSWGVGTARATITIVPPEPLTKAQVKAWAHGPLNGNVSIAENGDVTLSITDLPANTYVEARALYPASSFSAAPLVDGNITDKVLSEEKEWADQANATRSAVRTHLYGYSALGIGGALILFAIVLYLFLKYGREYKTFVPLDGKYWREDPRPDLPPALIGCLWRMGEVKTEDITATILDLTDRKVILMQETQTEKKRLIGAPKIEKDYHFKVDLEKLANEPSINQELVRFLIRTGWSSTEFSFDSINAYAEKSPTDFGESINNWKAAVKGQVEVSNLIEASSNTMQQISFTLSACILALGVFMFVQTCLAAGVVCLILAAPSLVMSRFMKRRSAEGYLLFRRYEGLKNYLTDFSRLDEVPPTSIVVWNRFLVLATVFGIADEVAKNLKSALPDMVASDDFAISYWWFYGPDFHTSSPFAGLTSTINAASAAAIAASAASSGAGLGGGFSGGGGFGGGGGGGGAG